MKLAMVSIPVKNVESVFKFYTEILNLGIEFIKKPTKQDCGIEAILMILAEIIFN